MSSTLKDKTIVWAEDDDFLGSVITKKLIKEEANVLHVSEGSTALETLSKVVPDVVLLDVLLPDKDGFEILASIKKDPRTKDVPVIMFSNLSQEENIQKAKDMGAVDFYVKSNLTPDQIVENVKEVLYS